MTHRGQTRCTAKAAAHVDVSCSTLWRWYKAGHVTPAAETPSGHLRWDIEELREQLRKLPPGELKQS